MVTAAVLKVYKKKVDSNVKLEKKQDNMDLHKAQTHCIQAISLGETVISFKSE